ncbi:MAG: hypothetical protein LBI10_05775, partial [Deltaproteobacteria bacterium]|nr:hypothetical protein [Deltaproteobacteria bacterium]
EGTLVNDGELILTEVVGQALGLTNLKIQFDSLISQAQDLKVVLSGNLTLSALTPELELLTQTDLALVAQINGQDLPAGLTASVILESGTLKNLPATAVVASGGVLTFSNVTAETLDLIQIRIQASSLSSNAVSLTVFQTPLPPDELTFSVTPPELSYGLKTSLTLTIRLNGNLLPQGSRVTVIPGPSLLVPTPEGTLVNDGELILTEVVGQALGLTNLRIQFGSLISPAQDLNVVLSGNLTLTALTPELELLTNSDLALVAQINGQELPAGLTASVILESGTLKNLPATAVVASGGLLTFSNVTAETLDLIQIRIQASSLTSNAASLTVGYNQGALTLSATPNSLEFLVPTAVVFSLTYLGQPLPSGFTVNLLSTDLKIAGLPYGATTDSQGQVKGSLVQALWPTGPLTVTAEVLGFTAKPTVLMDVYLVTEGIGAQFELNPFYDGSTLGLPKNEGPYIRPCQTFDLTLTLTYQGRLMANVPVTIEGFRFSANGLNTTTASGQISGTVYFDGSAKDEYLQRMTYEINVGGVTANFPGPKPEKFTSCQP